MSNKANPKSNKKNKKNTPPSTSTPASGSVIIRPTTAAQRTLNNNIQADKEAARRLDTRLVSNDPILQTVSRASFALIILFAFLLLWRGHNAPGGGFIAGLMTVCALLLHRIATGKDAARRLKPTALIPLGVGTSFLTAFIPYVLGHPFLKTAYGYISTPLTGEFEWTSAMIFDIGVFLTVLGAGLSIAYALIEVNPLERVREDL